MTDTVLEVKNLKKYFPVTAGLLRHQVGSVKAVDGIDFKMHEGEVLGIVGETGSGKSTVGRTAIRLLEPTAGEIYLLGQNITHMKRNQLKEMRLHAQIVFQDPYSSLNPRKTILDNIGESLLYHGLVHSKKEQIEQVAEVLERVGLSAEMMTRYPHQFSGGQQQRVCIGRAIALRPRLIVLDEALSALDVSVQAQVMNLLIELRKEMSLSYLFISHDLSLVRYLCDRVLVLYLGKVMEEGPTEELFHFPKHPYTQALLSAIPPSHPKEKMGRMALKGEIPSALNPPSGCPFRTRCPFAQPICAQTPPKKTFGKEGHIYHCILD